MLNRGETREDHGNAKCTGQQRREDKTGGHYALPKTQLRRASPWESIHYLSRARLGQSECRFLPRCPAMTLATPRCVLAGRLRHIGRRGNRVLRAGRRQGLGCCSAFDVAGDFRLRLDETGLGIA
jgi:hypothetical protein